jgi:nickel transport protein
VTGRALAAAAALAICARAAGHELRHEVVRGRAVALRAFYADGEPLAYAEYEVFAPSDPRIAHQKGRTDRAGWLAFVPVEPGGWRVKVWDTSGHGLEVEVPADVGPDAAEDGAGIGAKLPAVLRPLVGVVLVAAVFAGLILLHRLRRSP